MQFALTTGAGLVRSFVPHTFAQKDHFRRTSAPVGSIAEQIGLGHRRRYLAQQEHWAAERIALIPKQWRKDVQHKHSELYAAQGQQRANLWLLNFSERARCCRIELSDSDSDLRESAAAFVLEALGYRDHARSLAQMRQVLERHCTRWGINAPAARFGDLQAVSRMTDVPWVLRRLRKSHSQALEALAIELGYVRKGKGLYVSDESLKRRRQQHENARKVLANTEAMNTETGEIFTLEELAGSSTANKAIRRAELMTRIRGAEEVAAALGHAALFFTLTCPSRMHRFSGDTFSDNPKYDETTPAMANRYLGERWTLVRSKLSNEGIEYFGLRVAEPHHDGTPHWHMLVFVSRDAASKLEAVIRDYFMRDSGDEPGAQKYRVKLVTIDPAKGSAVGYVAKYIAKNIDAFGINEDEHGVKAQEAAERVEAWAGTWGIRQFQTFGMPDVSVWREFRRIDWQTIKSGPELLRKAWEAAQKSEERKADFGAFIREMGGPCMPRKLRPIKLLKQKANGVSRYGDPLGERPCGVQAEVEQISLSFRSYRPVFEVIGHRTAPQSESVRAKPRAPWTRVNNCTYQALPASTAVDAGDLLLRSKPDDWPNKCVSYDRESTWSH